MTSHLFLPSVDLEEIEPREEYRSWLNEWLYESHEEINRASVSSSMVLQGAATELVLFKRLRSDWQGVLAEFLTAKNGDPLAYSEEFGKKLYGFERQWRQTPVHAIHARFWISGLTDDLPTALDKQADLIESFIQPKGWIYNPAVSPTQLRTRMKSEYPMSMLMGIEILQAADRLASHEDNFKATLSDLPNTGYISAEYFRLGSLRLLDALHLAPSDLPSVLTACEAGEGYCDFSVASKVDDYMGTAHRTSRDVALHSPLAGLQALYISCYCREDVHTVIRERLRKFRDHLDEKPFDILPFTIRDLTIPFGTDITPLELIAASSYHVVEDLQ